MKKEEIEELKKKFGTIKTVIIPYDEEDPNKVLTFHCKKPDKATRKMISKLANGEVPERAVIAGFKSLRVAGDEVELLEKDEYVDGLIAAEEALIELLKVQKATIKKN